MSKIHASFSRMIDAKKALDTIKDKGLGNGYLDAVDGFFEEYSEEINFAGTQAAPSLSGLVLRSRGNIVNIDKAPLVAANPMVSGMGTYQDLADSVKARLTLTIDDANEKEVKALLQEMGGNT
ncbi:MAG: hypothetical protein N2484_09295 [Clostridia bacterium]|nr:hypothetical protein [Clostridia bacterium]